MARVLRSCTARLLRSGTRAVRRSAARRRRPSRRPAGSSPAAGRRGPPPGPRGRAGPSPRRGRRRPPRRRRSRRPRAVAPRVSRTITAVAPAYFATFASASDATKYAANSTGLGRRGPGSTTSSVGTAERRTSAWSAGSRPCSSAAGWIPRASSRSSASDMASSALAPATSCSAAPGSSRMRRWISESCRANVTSRCWAPSWRSRSMRRRSVSAAVTRRCAGGLELGEPRVGLRLQQPVLQCDRRRPADGLDQLGVVVERPVVHERGDRHAVARHPRHRSAGRRLGEFDRRAVDVDESAVRDGVGDRERRVVQHPRQCRLQVGGMHRGEPAEQVGQTAARQPGPQQAGEERDRHERDRARRDPEQERVARAAHDEVDAEQHRPQQQAERARDARQHRAAARRRGRPPTHGDHDRRAHGEREVEPALHRVDTWATAGSGSASRNVAGSSAKTSQSGARATISTTTAPTSTRSAVVRNRPPVQ